jgi:hypothetical protein
LPSWVPDWRSAAETVTVVPFEKTVESEDSGLRIVYHATGETLSFNDYRPVIMDTELYLHGFHLDIIEALYQSPDYILTSAAGVSRSLG